jgi:agmatinase
MERRSDRTSFLEEGAGTTFEQASVAVLPVPYEGTVSYGRGTSRGPAAILAASEQLELHDEQLGSETHRCGIWTAAALEGSGLSAERMAQAVESRVAGLIDSGKWVLVLGGEHSITPGAVRAATERHPGLHVLQLDAHADLREEYEGHRFSHACSMARCLEVAPVRAVGVRSYSADEARRIAGGDARYRLVHAWEMREQGWATPLLAELKGRPVYVTVDVDYFDPSLMPSTGTPEPGGAGWWTTIRFLDRVFESSHVVAADIVELAPIPGLHHADFTAARLAYKLIGLSRRAQ